jgi:hypothetical protein
VPFVFTSGAIQIAQEPDKIVILYNYDHQVRHVRVNEPHPLRVTPSWYGDSVGHYEGDTLVIDTVGVKIGPFAAVDWYGTPHTEALHVVEPASGTCRSLLGSGDAIGGRTIRKLICHTVSARDRLRGVLPC